MSLTVKSIKSLRPLLDRVVVQRIKPVEKTASGIFLPSASTNTPPPEALVLAVGPGALDKQGKVVPMSVKEGDKVVVPSFGGMQLKVGEEEYQVFRDAELVAKISE